MGDKSKKAGLNLSYAKRRAADGREVRNAKRRALRGFKRSKGRDEQAAKHLVVTLGVKPEVIVAIRQKHNARINRVRAAYWERHAAKVEAARAAKAKKAEETINAAANL